MRAVRLVMSFVVATAFAAIPVNAATNQVTNGTFDHDLSNWSALAVGQVNASWSSTYDAGSSSSSGSALLKDVASGTQASNTWYVGLGQCISASAGDTYHLAGTTGILKGQSDTGSVAVFVLFYSATNCNGGQIGNGNGFDNTFADGNWHVQSADGVIPAGTRSIMVSLGIHKDQAGGEFDGYFDNIVFSAVHGSGNCTADATHLCLTGNRFRVSVQWTDYNTNVTAAATAVPFVDESGFFYFQDPSNIEIMVKVHDACPSFGHFWFFSAATTNVGYTITVTDTKTGQTETYSNPAHVLSAANTDQSSFASCP